MKNFKDMLATFGQQPEDQHQPQVPFQSYNDMAQAEPEVEAAHAQHDAGYFAGNRAPAVMPKEGNFRAPASTMDDADQQEAPEARLERMMAELKSNRTRDLEDARSRELKGNLIGAFTDNIGTVVAGAQAMNTKASVTPTQFKSMEVPDLQAKVERQSKPEMDALLAQYKQLSAQKAKANAPMTAYQREMLDHMKNQLDQSKLNSDRGMDRHYDNHGFRRDKQDWAEKEKDEISDKQTAALVNYDSTLAAFDRIRAQKKKVNTGPVANTRNNIAAALGIDDPEVTSLRSEVIDTLANKIKALSGTASSESEVKRTSITLPELKDSDEVFERKLNDAETRLKEAKQIDIDHYKKQGKNPSKFENKAPAAMSPAAAPYGDTVEKGGKTYKWNASAGKYQLI